MPELLELAVLPRAAVARRGTDPRTWAWELEATASGNGVLQAL